MIFNFIINYGYLAVLVGTFLEGEAVLIMGGFGAYQGYLHLPWVILAAIVGAYAGDFIYFFIGRRNSSFLLNRFSSLRPRVDKMSRIVNRFHTPVIILLRFFYGMRMAGLLVLGMSRVPIWKFVLLNFIGVVLWASVIGIGGYAFGAGMVLLIEQIKHYQMISFAVIGFALFLFLAVRWFRRSRAVRNRIPEKRERKRESVN